MEGLIDVQQSDRQHPGPSIGLFDISFSWMTIVSLHG
jgi:hypothetical protein